MTNDQGALVGCVWYYAHVLRRQGLEAALEQFRQVAAALGPGTTSAD
jgi:hypothetical protein